MDASESDPTFAHPVRQDLVKLKVPVNLPPQICPATYVLSFDCSNATMTERLLSRAKTSGRVDDNIETIKKRLVTFETATAPVLDYYKNAGLFSLSPAISGEKYDCAAP